MDEVRHAVGIAAVVQEHVKLKQAGRTLKGLCPFHGEKTPSFHVDEAKGFYHCFGCDAGGDVFAFLMEREALSFPEAVKQLAARAGIAVPDSKPRGPQDELRDRILEINQLAQAAFAENLLGGSRGSGASDALDYLARRGISRDVALSFGLGWAPDAWDFLLNKLSGRFEFRELTASGMVVARQEGSGGYDRFRSRVTFPIRAVSKREVAFGGRIIGDGEPKYLNSPETPVYTKGRHLFGLDRARGSIRRTGQAVLVEGYLDAISLHAHGVETAVAVLGTALTQEQAALLKRYAERVVINFDGDSAGLRAARRSVEVLLAEGLEVKVLELPQGSDPDDYVRAEGSEAYERALESAPSFFEFLLQVAGREHELRSPEGRVKALQDVLPYLVRVDEPMLRSELADACSHSLRLRADLVHAELRSAMRSHGRQAGTDDGFSERAPRPSQALLAASQAERTLLGWLLAEASAIETFRALCQDFEMETLPRKAILLAILEEPPGQVNAARISDRLEDEDDRKLVARCAVDSELEPADLQALEPKLRGLMDELGLSANRMARDRKGEVERELAEAILGGRAEAAIALRDELHELARKMHQ